MIETKEGVVAFLSPPKNTVSCNRVAVPSSLEMVWVIASSKSHQVLLGVCYRPPDYSHDFVTELHEALFFLSKTFPRASMTLLGDFDYPHIG